MRNGSYRDRVPERQSSRPRRGSGVLLARISGSRSGGDEPGPGRRDELTTPSVIEPVAGYDGLSARDVFTLLPSRSRSEQAAIESYELAHRNRQTVLSRLRR